MSRLVWGNSGEHFYEAGVDRGVLYIDEHPGVPWVGLISVTENATGGEANPYYLDGVKYSNRSSPEDFEATITAYTYPDLFAQCDGTHQPRSGLFITHQRKKTFGFSYRSMVGNDLSNEQGYKIHIVYNALASPTERENATINDEIEPLEFSWTITTRPPAMAGYKPTAHVVIDSRYTDPAILSIVEDILYGNDTDTARLPTFPELVDAFDTISGLTITDNGDGTWTATAPFDVIRMLDETTFEITSPTAIFLDEDTYTISSE